MLEISQLSSLLSSSEDGLSKVCVPFFFSSLLVGAIQTAGLTELMNQAGPHTVFALTNDAFSALPKADLNKLMGKDSPGSRHSGFSRTKPVSNENTGLRSGNVRLG